MVLARPVRVSESSPFEALIGALRQEHARLIAKTEALEKELGTVSGWNVELKPEVTDVVHEKLGQKKLDALPRSPRSPRSPRMPSSAASSLLEKKVPDAVEKKCRDVTPEEMKQAQVSVNFNASQPLTCPMEGADLPPKPDEASQMTPKKKSKFTRDTSITGRFAVTMEEENHRNSFMDLWQEIPNTTAGKLVHTVAFETLTGTLILLNACLLGHETNYMATNGGMPHKVHEWSHIFFNAFFIVELLLRFVSDRSSLFFGKEWRWNWLDIVLVAFSTVDLLISLGDLTFALAGRSLRVVRLLRLLRTLRLFRTLKSFHEFHKMLFALLSSLRTLVCSLVILFFVVYFFAVMICQGVTDFRFQENGGSEAENKALAHLYGSLSQSVFTLFSSVSDGMGWTNAIEPLQKMDGIYTYSVLIYITLVIFGVTNVVTSVFVESAMKSERHYRELIVQEKQHAKEVAAGHMREVFKAMDADGSGEISAEEMDFFLTEPALNNYVEALGISAENTRMLFKLMDVDGSGRIDVDEFCEGCLRLQGEAKSIDVHLGNYQVRQFLSKWADFTDYVDDRFLELGALMEDYTNDEEGDLRRRVSEDFGSQRAASHQSNPRDTVVKLEGILGDSAVTPEENTNPTCLHDSRSSQPKNQRPSMSSAASMEEEDTVAVGEDADTRKPPRGAVRERVQDSSAVGEDDEARVPSRARRSVHQSVYQRGRDRAVKVSLPGLALEDERKTKGTGTPALKMRCIDEGQIAGNGNDGGRSTMPTIVGCSTGGRSEDEQKKGVVTLG